MFVIYNLCFGTRKNRVACQMAAINYYYGYKTAQ